MLNVFNMEKKIRLQAAALIINNETFPIYEGVNMIGRDKDAIVNIKHVNISKYHAIIFVLNGQHYISDLNSSNGCTTESSRMVPFNIYQLKNNSLVTIGGLEGTYISEAPFPDKSGLSRNNLSTQSFYECNTQLLENSVAQNGDIHEAATQEISWAWAKPKQKKNINEESTEIIDIPPSPNKVTLEDDEATDCEDNLEEIIPNNVTKNDENSNDSMDFLKDDKDTDLDSGTEEFTSKRTRKSVMVISSQDIGSDSLLEADKKKASCCFDNTIPATQNVSAIDFNDSDIIPSTQDIHKDLNKPSGWSEESFKLGLTELMIDSPLESNDSCVQNQENETINDGSAGDCILDLTTQKVHVKMLQDQNEEIHNVISNHDNKNEDILHEASIESETENIFNATTQEVNVKLARDLEEDIYDLSTQKISNDVVAPITAPDINVLEDHFFQSSTQKVNNTASTHDQEDIYDIATQKISQTIHQVISVDNHDSETEPSFTAPTKKVQVQGSTHDQEDDIYDLATQKMDNIICQTASVGNHDSETSFTLPTQKVDIRDSTHDEEDDTYDLATQKISYDFKNHEIPSVVTQVDNRNSEIEILQRSRYDQEEDIYDLATQKISYDVESNKIPSVAPIITQVDNRNSELETDFNAPTQKLVFQGTKHDQEEDIYDLATQKISYDFESNKIPLVDNQNSELADFNAPTQKLVFEGTKHDQEEDIYDLATQKISYDVESNKVPINTQEEDIFDLSTQKVSNDVKNNTPSIITTGSETEIYDLATQKIDTTQQTHAVDGSDSETQNMFNTRKVPCDQEHDDALKTKTINVADEPDMEEKTGKHVGHVTPSTSRTQEELQQSGLANESVASRELNQIQKELSDINKKPKKKYSFKKRLCNLDSSLSVLSDKTSKRETGSANNHTDSNKSFAILESKLTKTKKSKGTSEIQVTVPKGRRSMTLSLRDDSSSTSRASKKTNDDSENQKVMPKAENSLNSRQRRVTNNEAPLRKSSRHSTKIGLINNNEIENVKVKAAGKRKASSSSSSCTATTPPKKQKIELIEAVLDTPQRGLRKQKPKVVFTMLDNPRLESLIKQLGGSIVESVEACTVLVTEHVKRSQKLLSAIGLGKPICSPKWITESKKNQEFLDPWDYLLTDPEAEKKWDFSLKESFNRSRADKLLESHSFYVQITNGADVLKGAIESCGGKCLTKFPNPPPDDTYIISSPDNRNKYNRIIKKHPNVKVLEAEAIFDGVLRQELRFSKHIIG